MLHHCAQVLQFTKVTFGYSPDKILYRDIDFGVDLVRPVMAALMPGRPGSTECLCTGSFHVAS